MNRWLFLTLFLVFVVGYNLILGLGIPYILEPR